MALASIFFPSVTFDQNADQISRHVGTPLQTFSANLSQLGVRKAWLRRNKSQMG